MYQNDRGSYRTQESLFAMFYHTCFGKLVILAVVLGVLAIIAHFTRPSEQTMREEMIDNIRQCIERSDSIHTDWIDDAVANVGYIFTTADSVIDKELLNNFKKYNRLEYYDRWLYSSMHVYNNFRPEGIRCGFGVFGVVVPTVNFNDLLLRVGPVRRDYNQPAIRSYGEDEYFGTTPDLIFHEGEYE
ncbi:MAG: hypothetical protein IJ841_04500 [Prevotella sp.]|nr:hypothetical protein [Prevotella sp.]